MEGGESNRKTLQLLLQLTFKDYSSSIGKQARLLMTLEHIKNPLASSATTLPQRLTRAAASLIGWKVEIQQETPQKCIIIGAHHTSNWDFVAAMFLLFSTNVKFNFIAKDSLFRGPFKRLMLALGGIPVNRRTRTNFVDQIVQRFQSSETLRIAISPEGTRKQTTHWKTGFYYIALGAKVPIVLGYVDYLRKAVGLGPSLLPSGDIRADFELIRDFYSRVTARHPLKVSEMVLLG